MERNNKIVNLGPITYIHLQHLLLFMSLIKRIYSFRLFSPILWKELNNNLFCKQQFILEIQNVRNIEQVSLLGSFGV